VEECVVLPGTPQCSLTLRAEVSLDLWRCSPTIARPKLMAKALQLVDLLGGHGPAAGPSRAFRLSDVFEEISAGEVRRGPPPPEVPHTAGFLGRLSEEVLGLVMSHCTAVDLGMFASTCRLLRRAAAPVVPGLLPRLFPHQDRALAWMLERETGRRSIAHPAYQRVGSEDAPVFVDMVSGGVLLHELEVPIVRDVQGGFFCDEPGLGKTVTCLALVLKTLGQRAGRIDPDAYAAAAAMNERYVRYGQSKW
jgi:hypothetical protein